MIATFLSCLVFSLSAQTSTAQETAPQSATSAVPQVAAQAYPVVVELFTSQGCSSCPPADALLAELAKRDDVLALALHVDYWDYIGWKDIFADPKFTKRQRQYAKAAGHRTIYTPQMIVAGQDHIVGFKPMKVADLIVKHRHASLAPVMGLSAQRSGKNLTISLTPLGALPSDLHVQVVGFRPLETVGIRLGENAGKSIDYANVVTSWIPVDHWDGQRAKSLSVDLVSDDPVAVIVQKNMGGLPGEIIAATRVN